MGRRRVVVREAREKVSLHVTNICKLFGTKKFCTCKGELLRDQLAKLVQKWRARKSTDFSFSLATCSSPSQNTTQVDDRLSAQITPTQLGIVGDYGLGLNPAFSFIPSHFA